MGGEASRHWGGRHRGITQPERSGRTKSSGDNTSLTNNVGSFDFWGGGWVSLEDRWGITGRLLQQKARQVYLLPGKEHITLPWFDDEGTPLWSRHVMNRDTQEDTREKYVTSLVENGWLLG